MTTKTRDEVLVEAIEQARNGQFNLTAFKVEFEILFNRFLVPIPERAGCLHCVKGTQKCLRCDGSGNAPNHVCWSCRGAGFVNCDNCQTSKTVRKFCDMAYIHDRILRKIEKYGLSERLQPGERYANARKWKPVYPLAYSEAMDDMSVDTELTLTVMMDNPGNAWAFVRVAEAFYSLRKDIMQEVDVSNAGMHITALATPDGHYYRDISPTDKLCFDNFRKSMILLMPALYFLGSSNDKTRQMKFRKPRISGEYDVVNDADGAKYSAIYYRGGGLEFRVFDTCYDNPEAIIDNLIVICNCLRFWTKKYTRNYLQKVANNVNFGLEGSKELKRMYVTNEHIDLLNRGLRMIKPAYYSITELKRQRGFTITKHETGQRLKNARLEAEKQYIEYDKKFGWELAMQKRNYINERIGLLLSQTVVPDPEDEETIKRIETEAEVDTKAYEITHKQSLTVFCATTIPKIANPGEYKLCVE